MTYLLLYFFLYRLAMIVAIPLLMVALSHTDRVHIRERARRLGRLIVNNTRRYVDNTRLQKYSHVYILILYYLRLYGWRPLCIVSEVVSGFGEGVENLEPTTIIQYESQKLNADDVGRDSFIIDLSERPLEYKNRENEQSKSSEQSTLNSKSLDALEIIANSMDDTDEHCEPVSISTQGTDDYTDEISSDAETDNTGHEDVVKMRYDRRSDDRNHRDECSDSETTGSVSVGDSDISEVSNDSEASDISEIPDDHRRERSRSESPRPQRHGFRVNRVKRVKRVAPKALNRPKIRLGRRH